MVFTVAILFLVLATPAVYAANHVVGGSSGWNTGVDYTSWANGETFSVGDTLVFNYGFSHGVDQVSQDDYTNCNTGNPISSNSGGSTTITLKQTGSMYFLCPNSGHCGQGMKLAVNVQGGTGSPSGSPSTPSTPSNGSPSTPNNSSPNAPSNSPSGASSFGSINHLMLGFSFVLAALFVRG